MWRHGHGSVPTTRRTAFASADVCISAGVKRRDSLSEEAHCSARDASRWCEALLGSDQGRCIEFEKDWQASNCPACLQSRPFQPDRVPYVHSGPGWVSWPRVWPQWTSEKCGLWSLHKSKHSLSTTAGPAERSSFRHRVLSAGMRHATCNVQHGE